MSFQQRVHFDALHCRNTLENSPIFKSSKNYSINWACLFGKP